MSSLALAFHSAALADLSRGAPSARASSSALSDALSSSPAPTRWRSSSLRGQSRTSPRRARARRPSFARRSSSPRSVVARPSVDEVALSSMWVCKPVVQTQPSRIVREPLKRTPSSLHPVLYRVQTLSLNHNDKCKHRDVANQTSRRNQPLKRSPSELRRRVTSHSGDNKTRRGVDGHEDLGVLGRGVLETVVGHVDRKVVLQAR